MKAYFMNEIHELKNEICFLKNQLENGEKNSHSISYGCSYGVKFMFLYSETFLYSEAF